ncbi:hypothetical protein V7075_26815 [Neobacillus drentensis]|uniref:hypothetical protein n=1 Tax=Neobacillus drentensis TaxID=220684 RepID=UPI002FFFAC6D
MVSRIKTNKGIEHSNKFWGGNMYTYDSFETLGSFTLLRPIFITVIIASLALFFILVVPKFKKKLVNGFTVFSVSAISIVVSGQLLFYHAIVADEINLGGDTVSTYLFFVIIGICIVNCLIFLFNQKEEEKKTPPIN